MGGFIGGLPLEEPLDFSAGVDFVAKVIAWLEKAAPLKPPQAHLGNAQGEAGFLRVKGEFFDGARGRF
jgi:hypothetical protein